MPHLLVEKLEGISDLTAEEKMSLNCKADGDAT